MVCNIDLGGAEWTPIGTGYDPFIGEFDGQGYTVSNFKITTGRAYVGLFGYNEGVIKNLGVENFTVNVSYSGKVYAGGLAGSNSGSILNSYATGEVSATSTSSYSSSYAYAGGLVGYNSGDITNSYAAGNVSATAFYAYAGGLVGYNSGGILNSYATGNVSATSTGSSSYASAYAGGLVGYNTSSGGITNSYATGDVSATADVSAYAGGLVGSNYRGSITNSYATGNVSATGYYAYAGGLVGENDGGSITNCYRYSGQTFYRKKGSTTYSTASNTLGTAVSLENLKSPSWVNENLWTIEFEIWDFSNGYPTLDYEYIDSAIITISTAEEFERLQGQTLVLSYELNADIDLGGMEWTPVAIFHGTFNGNGYTVSNFKITTGRQYVGLFGYNGGVIKNLGVENFTVNVSYSGNVYAGGLVGFNAGGDITNSYATGDVSATSTSSSSAYAGGLVGDNDSGSILNSYAAGEVSATADDSAYAGGLVGYNSGSITNSYATGEVSATSTSSRFAAYAGGLVGEKYGGSITNSYATGDVSATGPYAYAGGLVGDNDSGDITNSYAAGDVSATGSSSAYAGGLVGYSGSNGTITNCYRYSGQTFYRVEGSFDTYSTASNTLGTEEDLTTLQSVSFHTSTLGWDESVWNFVGGAFPTLKNAGTAIAG